MQIALMTKIAISHELLVRFGPNKNQRKAYSVHRLFVIVSVSFGAFLTSGLTMKCFTLVQISVSHKRLVRFGQNKNQRKSYSVHRLLVIVSVLFGTFVMSQVTKYCVTLLIRWGYQQINGKMWSNPETGRRGQLCLSTEDPLIVIVSGSFGSLVTSQVTICKFYFRNIFVISHELLVQFGLNKNKLIASIGLSS